MLPLVNVARMAVRGDVQSGRGGDGGRGDGASAAEGITCQFYYLTSRVLHCLAFMLSAIGELA